MKRHALLSLITAVFIAVSPVFAQPPDTLWTGFYGGHTDEDGFSAQQTLDGGFVMAGYSRVACGSADGDFLMIKTNSAGDLTWSRIYDLNFCDRCFDVRQTRDGGYILVGFTGEIWWHNLWLIKTDADGYIEWQTVYGQPGSSWELGYCVRQTPDGGYVTTGYCGPPMSSDVRLMKFDSLGRVQWRRSYGGSYIDYGWRLELTADGGYIIIGTTASFGAGLADIYLLKTDSLGNVQWERTYGGTADDYGFGVQQTPDGGYILAGGTMSFGAGARDVYLVKINAEGDTLWTRTFGGALSDNGSDIMLTYDGGYLIAGYTSSFGAGYWDVYLIRTNASGSLLWQQTVGWDEGSEAAGSIKYTSDGGYIVGGTGWNATWQADDFILIRFEGEGELPQVAVTLTPQGPPIVIPPSGGSFNFTLQVSNNDSSLVNFDTWIEAVLPDSSLYGPIILRSGLQLAPGDTLTRVLTQQVPAGALAGNYTYRCKTGFYPTVIFAFDQFIFSKSGDGKVDLRLCNVDWESTSEPFKDAFAGTKYDLLLQAKDFHVYGACPNPFNSFTTLSFALPEASKVNLMVFDVSGHWVATPVNGWREAGSHEVTFDGSNLASGMYLYRLQAGEFSASGKMVLVK